ncbi:M23 family metallopeptidase [Helicobacter mustelae]|uniref:Putative periplasmic protein n=1 Tax=Helicobacter mustelae (strain ATCC 43772 / CCUG 25715 / CIP 103759 / LMG 18044 / NCTC 12198 / R85-136P) TaxID=679897 RepID=D3UG12_HELM1|nr:M23 family metallopeptidase [Helicobacter mustelae]CBG39433.1 putative periplasmic protein [Helicobacter mustelae 12198]SQH70945.1 putative M23/M37 family peptidase [Helicobacter mustelae]
MKLRTLLQIFLLLCVGFFGYWIYHSKFFEKNPPKVSLMVQIGNEEKEVAPGSGFWNPYRDMILYMSDDSGIRSYHILAKSSDGKVLIDKQEAIIKRSGHLKVPLPKPDLVLRENDRISYEITVNDWSNSHFFSGNITKLKYDFALDTEAPLVHMVASSYKISYGGSALLIFQVEDKSTQEVRVSNGVDSFRAFPFLKEGYYALLIAWPIKNKMFNGSITAIDKAFNTKKVAIPIIKDPNVRYRYSDIKVSDQFLSTKLDSLIDIIGERSPSSFTSALDKFKYINELIREKDENIIFGITSNVNYPGFAKPLVFNVFSPLKKAQVVGSFGDHRTYLYRDKKFSKSVHLGLDLANFKNAPVFSSNAGRVLFTGLLGVYGNTILIDHGLGLSSLYSHLSVFEVKTGDRIPANTEIARTGYTGWAFGDHLHLGIYVQGYPVRVIEWMDPKWIKWNITDVLQRAQNAIEGRQ